MATEPDEPLRRPGTPSENDLPPAGGEAERQRAQTTMPIVWIAMGIVVVVLFVIAVMVFGGHGHVPSPLPAPHG
jgi:heme/copper-type cytochrome/quinol oxidase subunit 2